MLGWRTRFGCVVAIAGAAACALGGSAATAGATTIGANGPIATGSQCNIEFTTAGQGAVWLDSTYTVPAGGGQISSFAFQNDGQNAGVVLDFAVLRPVLGVWVVIGHTGLNTLGSDSALDSFSPPEPILTAAGDVIGFFQQTAGANQTSTLHDCAVTGSGQIHLTQVAPSSGPPILGAGVVNNTTDASGRDLNLSAQLGGLTTGPDIVGAGVNNPSKGSVNLFSLTGVSAGGFGTLTFTSSSGGTHVFGGVITCIDRVDNAATIVAHDPSTGFFDRAQALDGGSSGDKLINTMWDPSKFTRAQNARLATCTAPNTDALAAANALGGDYIQFAAPSASL